MPRYAIRRHRGRTNLGYASADNPRDALALFAVEQGYADPRTAERTAEEPGYLFQDADGSSYMILETFELVAVEIEERVTQAASTTTLEADAS